VAKEIFLLQNFQSGCEAHQLPIKEVMGALSLGVERPSSEDDRSLPSSAKVKNEWSYTSILY